MDNKQPILLQIMQYIAKIMHILKEWVISALATSLSVY